jgi:glycosyltransferase involved in cell wall biosynthesis
MKILFVQKMAGISGSELYLMQILPELKKRGYQVEILIIYPEDATIANQRMVHHMADHNIPAYQLYGNSSLSPLLLIRVNRILKKGNYDLVQTNLVHADLWLALVKLFFRWKLKIISVKHGFDEKYTVRYGYAVKHLNSSLFAWVQKFSNRLINYNITISKGLYNMYIDGKITPKSKIINIYYGVDLLDKSKNIVLRRPEVEYALILGRLIQCKGHEFVFDAWKKVSEKNSNWKLYIVGNGEYEDKLKELVKNNGLEDAVVFCGYQPNPHQVISDARFMIVSSTAEGFGLIILEAWLHKKPIVSFDVPAMNEIIGDGETGIIVPAFDTDKLAEKIIYLFENEEIVDKYGYAGYEKLLGYYTVSRMTDETIEVYNKVASKKK